jgi:membrane-associated phospholipid phosphatase
MSQPADKNNRKSQDVEEAVGQAVEGVREEVQRNRSPWYQVSRRTRLLIGCYLALFVIFTILAFFVRNNPILPADVAITQELQEPERRTPWFFWLMAAVSWLGNASQFWLFASLIGLTALVFWLVGLRLEALFIIGQSVVSGLLNILLKTLISRPRPAAPLVEVLQYANGQSFPSGHVMAYVAYWGLLCSFGLILFKRERWWTVVLLCVPTFFVVTVGISRVYLGDHWASDVLGGYLFGGLLLGLSLWLYLALKRRAVLAR